MSNKTVNNRISDILVAGGAVLATAAFALLTDQNKLTFKQYKIRGKGKISSNLRLVFLTDLHDACFGEENCELLDMIDEADPDIILMGGDMPTIKNCVHINNSMELCRNLAKKYPVFYGNGNHEQRYKKENGKYLNGYYEYKKAIEDAGVVVLSNETACFKKEICITGLELDEAAYRKLVPSGPANDEITRKIGHLDKSKYNILLAHSPEFLINYAASGADLVLSGHYHGGIVGLPGGVGLVTPQGQLFSSKVTGWKEYGQTDMIISPGLGTHSVNLRINNKPQVIVVDIIK